MKVSLPIPPPVAVPKAGVYQVDAYIAAGGKPRAAVQNALWEAFGEVTVALLVDGASVLAGLWLAAWNAADGNALAPGALSAVDLDALKAIYQDPSFVPSVTLDQLGQHLKA